MKSTKCAVAGLAALVAVLSAGVVPSTASAAPPAATVWKAKPAPVLGGASLSCVSVSDCWTVTSTDVENPQPVVERWNGSHWSAPQDVPLPPGGTAGSLLTIRCLSDHFCAAAGARFHFNTVPFTAIWNGTSWSSKVPVSGTSGVLFDVDCVSTTNCVAVGQSHGPGHALAVHWNGRSWSRDSLPSTIGSPSELVGVSCSSASNCVAVGNDNSHRETPVVIRWNGTAWASESAQRPPGAPPTYLDDVSCPAKNNCYAVGSSALGNGHRYMQHWDGAHWSTVNTPAPPVGSTDIDRFTALTCTVQVCTVAGYVASSTPTEHYTLFIDRGAGGHWTVESPPPATGSNTELSDVACVSATTCFAIGGAITSSSNQPNIFDERT